MEAEQKFLPQTSASEVLDLSEDSGRIGDQYLRFRLHPSTVALLPVQHLAEIATVGYSAVIPVPGMPAWVSGIYNWRGGILWVVDLGHFLGLTPWQERPTVTDTHSIAIIRSPDTVGQGLLTLGAIVQAVEDIDFYNSDEIASPPEGIVTPEMAPFLQGVLSCDSDNNLLLVLDRSSIFERMSHPANS